MTKLLSSLGIRPLLHRVIRRRWRLLIRHQRSRAKMLKAVLRKNEDGEPMLVLGLSKVNMALLLEGRPIVVEPKELDPKLPQMSVLIMGGEDEASMQAELFERMGIEGPPPSEVIQ